MHMFYYYKVRNPSSNLCMDTMGKDEKEVFNMRLFYCQNGASANEVRNFFFCRPYFINTLLFLGHIFSGRYLRKFNMKNVT